MSSKIPASGTVLGGKYRVVRLLGEGGMGVVLEAENELTGKRVAIKWLHPELAEHPEGGQRLIREAQASSKVRHPNVVDVYDIAKDEESLFIVMEFLEGETLEALLHRGSIPMHELVSLIIPAMRGVQAAHKAGIIHRDIKPANIFLTVEDDNPRPIPKVLDFGISKVSNPKSLSLTKTGAAMGTPMYMSYEQLTGVKDLDHRTDVYAFGVILYEAITGQAPFEAETFPQLAIMIATQEPTPPRQVREGIPASLERIVQKAMAKQRDARIPNMQAFIEALEPFSTERGFREQMSDGAAPLPLVPTDSSAGTGPVAKAPSRQTERSDLERDSMGRVSMQVAPTMPGSGTTLGPARTKVLIAAAAAVVVLSLGAWATMSGPSTPQPAAAAPPSLPTAPKLAEANEQPLSAQPKEKPAANANPQLEPSALKPEVAAVVAEVAPVLADKGEAATTRSADSAAEKRRERKARKEAEAAAAAAAAANKPAAVAAPSPCGSGRAGVVCSSDFK